MPKDLFAKQPKDLFADAPIRSPRMVGATHEPHTPSPSGFAMGAMDPIYGASQLLSEAVPENVRKSIDELNNWLASKGLPLQELGEGGVTQQVQEREQAYQQARQAAGEEGVDVGRLAGTVATGLIPGAGAAKLATGLGKVAGGAIGGAGMAAAMPVTEGDFWKEKAKQTGVGGLAGALIPGVAGGVSRVVSPQTAPAVQQMIKEGVRVTPGQIIGGVAKRAEEAATSVPFVGDVIGKAQRRGIEDFNKAALNRALAPLGKQTDEIGYKGIEKAHGEISRAYDDLLPKMKIQSDDAFSADLQNIRGMAENMLPARAQQFEKILEGQVFRKFEATGKMNPKTMKEVDSQLGKMASKFKSSQDADQQMLGDALGEVQTSLRDMVSRANPEYAPQLSKVNEAYANLLRVENAAARTGAKGGVFTPNQLEAATRATDRSLRKRQSAQGQALMQDLASAGEEAIAQRLPTSGTAERAMVGLGGGAAAGGLVSPVIPAAMAGTAGLYTQPAQRLAQMLMTARPSQAAPVAESIRRLAPYLTPGAVAGSQGITNGRY